jgi:hypothetical protein
MFLGNFYFIVSCPRSGVGSILLQFFICSEQFSILSPFAFGVVWSPDPAQALCFFSSCVTPSFKGFSFPGLQQHDRQSQHCSCFSSDGQELTLVQTGLLVSLGQVSRPACQHVYSFPLGLRTGVAGHCFSS